MPKKDDNMPPEDQAQTTETDTTLESATEEAHTAISTAENPENTIYTLETQPDDTPSNIYNTLTGNENEGNIEPPSTAPQITVTTTPNETAPYTGTNQTPPDISQYPTFTTPGTQEALITEQLYPHAATVGSTRIYDPSDNNSLDETYKSIMNKHKNPEISLREFIELLYEITEDTKEEPSYITPAEIAIKKYKKEHDTVINRYNTDFEQLLEECTEYSNEAQAYIDFFKDIGLIEETGKFTKVIDEKYLELMQNIYAIPADSEEYLNILNEHIQETGIEDNMILNYLELNEIPKTPLLAEPQTPEKYPISPIKALS